MNSKNGQTSQKQQDYYSSDEFLKKANEGIRKTSQGQKSFKDSADRVKARVAAKK